MAPPVLTLYFDLVSPYSAMVLQAAANLAEEAQIQLDLQPILMGGLLREIGAPEVLPSAWNPAKERHARLDMVRQARLFGVAYRWPAVHPRRSLEAQRLLVCCPAERRLVLALALASAAWERGQALDDRSFLAQMAESVGIRVDDIDLPATKEALRATTHAAAAAGAFGVPTFVLSGEGAAGEDAKLWWGADRLPHIRQHLGLGGGLAYTGPARPMRVFHDFASPFSYLGVASALASPLAAQVELVPVLLGALFRSLGTPNVPLFAMVEARRRWYAQDLACQAAALGLPFQFPSAFPVRSVNACRMVLAVPPGPDRDRLTLAIYRGLWVEDQDIGQLPVLHRIATDLGLDADGLCAATQGESVKQQLRLNTEGAEAAGVFGVPTYQVEDGPVIWGVDRIPLLNAVLSGMDLLEVDAWSAR
jgi:2-hydroxychromene-2-carboxylate isomerase